MFAPGDVADWTQQSPRAKAFCVEIRKGQAFRRQLQGVFGANAFSK
jgi:hypothetical protein